ncbi:ABC transporter substrate-binding protein [Candidatus Woesearchaeota archaeon]|nr:ABC transporter substrate-binding protein [Candidatus Woesearchaeota archaeon]
MKKLLSIFSVLVIAMFLIAGCSSEQPTGNVVKSQPTTQAAAQGDIKVGWIGPLTGEAASFGQNALAAATLAVNEINAAGGINGRKLVLIAEDDSCSAAGVAAMQKLVNVNNVDVIAGPVCSASAGPALPVAVQAGTPVMMFTASAPGLTALGDRVFRVYPSDSFQGKEAANFMYNTLGTKKVAIVYAQNEWGQGIQKVFKQQFESLGGEIVYEGGVTQDSIDFRTDLAKVKNSGALAIFAPLHPAQGVSFVKQTHEAGLQLPLLGGDAWSGDEFIKSGQTNGALYMLAKSDVPETLTQKIHTLKGFENLEVGFVAPFAYDSVKVMALAMQKAGTDKAKIVQELYKTSYKGVSSPTIEFDSQGDLKYAVFEVKQVENNQAVAYR